MPFSKNNPGLVTDVPNSDKRHSVALFKGGGGGYSVDTIHQPRWKEETGNCAALAFSNVLRLYRHADEGWTEAKNKTYISQKNPLLTEGLHQLLDYMYITEMMKMG